MRLGPEHHRKLPPEALVEPGRNVGNFYGTYHVKTHMYIHGKHIFWKHTYYVKTYHGHISWTHIKYGHILWTHMGPHETMLMKWRKKKTHCKRRQR